MRDPREIYTVDEEAVSTQLGDLSQAPDGAVGPVLVHALRGFVDAGSVGELVVDHLRSELSWTRLVTFDVDELLDYRSKRSTMTFDVNRWSDYDEPVLAIDHVRDAEGTGFLVLHGFEPDLQWERFAAAVSGLVERFGVSLTATVHGVPMGVPHTRPATVTAHATTAALVGDVPAWFGTVKVPASAAALLELRLGQRGHDALGFAIHVPHYLAQSPYPPAAVAAVERLERTTGLDLAAAPLEEAAREATEEVERQVADSEEVAAVVHALEEQFDAFARSVGRDSLLAQEAPIPTAEELGAEFERYLRQHDQQ
ncbi:PAC2 family protein [Cellulomonas sp. PhB143]|uniref:PAC2 family protein n=1 Tax=Cellulomonas sp. PhB143 TaxID=2485186 RepID=UPI000F49F6C3|nr:PAC2 family protein [Cellulomonas sp. PhB143]ROS77195.1 proteasome assembly chaperone (PAC2) family protein [Cellulomonas sp. PhB143]